MWQSNQVPCSTGAFWKTWLDESANEATSQLLWPKRLNENSNNDRHQKKNCKQKLGKKMQTLITFQTTIKAIKYKNYAI